jgi:Neocarzinostatin family
MGVITVDQIDALVKDRLSTPPGSTTDETAFWTDIGRRLARRQRARRMRRRVGITFFVALVLVFSAGVGLYLAGSTTSLTPRSHSPNVFDPQLGRGGFTVTPNTNLVNRQKVTISIRGLEPESTIWLVMCVGHPTSVRQAETQCITPGPPQAVMVDLNQRGAAQVRFRVDRYPAPGGDRIDCATYADGCSIGLGNPLTFDSAHVTGNIEPVTFKNTPPPPGNPLRISVAPAAPFTDGQEVTLSGSGFPSNSALRVAECPTNADCGPYFQNVDASTNGSFSVSMTLHRTFTVEQEKASGGLQSVTFDCSQPLRCFLMAEEDAPPYHAASSIPLTFQPSG